ncbi:unnamed protein product [Euphydryas editha]|uniref:Uncharacterized protein n=1 Tax=Euphydryas editha TaxID=104508 RepID=A0AAU9U2I7_EUPED|nr:unnamed protein product [Euphydryas editha]
MTSLKHGVNLSRRACRQHVSLLAIAALLAGAAANPVESTTKTSPSITVDGISTYPGLGFGPMGPVAPLPGEPPGTQLHQQQETTTETTTTAKPKKERTFVIAAVEFHRVETPFIIGLWIFFASIAKIGMFINMRILTLNI